MGAIVGAIAYFIVIEPMLRMQAEATGAGGSGNGGTSGS